MTQKTWKVSSLDAVILLAIVLGVIFYDASSYSMAVKAALICLVGFTSVYIIVRVFARDSE